MSSEVKVNSPEFESLIGSIENKVGEIKTLITDIDNDMSNLDGSHPDIWNGRAQDILYNHYKNVHVKFPDMEKRLDEYLVFLKNTLDLYKQEENAQEKSVNNQEDSLDVM